MGRREWKVGLRLARAQPELTALGKRGHPAEPPRERRRGSCTDAHGLPMFGRKQGAAARRMAETHRFPQGGREATPWGLLGVARASCPAACNPGCAGGSCAGHPLLHQPGPSAPSPSVCRRSSDGKGRGPVSVLWARHCCGKHRRPHRDPAHRPSPNGRTARRAPSTSGPRMKREMKCARGRQGPVPAAVHLNDHYCDSSSPTLVTSPLDIDPKTPALAECSGLGTSGAVRTGLAQGPLPVLPSPTRTEEGPARSSGGSFSGPRGQKADRRGDG